MSGLVAVLIALAASGILAFALFRQPRFSVAVGAGGAMLACGVGFWISLRFLLTGASDTLRLPWLAQAGGSFYAGIDPLSAFFLTALFLVCGLSALYGARYMDAGQGGPRSGLAWLWYNLLVASMALVLLARNGLLFLAAWEMMAIASFFLVTHEDEHQQSRIAGRIYLIATHLGTVFVFIFMLAMARETGSFDFETWRGVGVRLAPALCSVLFICLLVGFGTKAGFVPLHTWLPEAHPAAPCHVSAVMSGIMIKTGIYALLRFLPCLGAPPLWWGWVLISVGIVSGVLGILFALAQQDTKRVLAYSSVENIGIIALGIGIGMTGVSLNIPLVAVLGFAGGLLHAFNHALFKSLLFLGAGSVAKATGTREIDRLGGLLKRMPATGSVFLVGAAAISGLPLLNGFVGEFMIYWGSLAGVNTGPGVAAVPLLAGIAGLALIGGLAAACFAKLFGVVFLGEPRTAEADRAREVSRGMVVPMAILAACCACIGLAAPQVFQVLRPVLANVVQLPQAGLTIETVAGSDALFAISFIALVAVILVLAGVVLRRMLLSGKAVGRAVTWDCGYARPSARMQYTASSFADPLVGLFSALLRSRRRFRMAPGLFPSAGSLETETRDVFRERVFTPAFLWVDRWLSFLKWLQSGRIQLYVLYIVITLLVLSVWVLRVQA